MAQELERETYARHCEHLQRTAPGKFALIHEDQLAGLFDTREDAETLGALKFGQGSFLIQQIAEEPPAEGEGTAGPHTDETRPTHVEEADSPPNASVEEDRPQPHPPGYERVWRRMEAMERVPPGDRRWAWEWLLVWRQELCEKHDGHLPAPWVFASEADSIEYVWDLPYCSLSLVFVPGGPMNYRKRETLPDRDVEETGSIDVEAAPGLLLWLVGR